MKIGFKLSHGGRRAGAGRPNLSGRQAHLRRTSCDRRYPAHVTLKLAPGLPSLRRKDVFRCLRASIRTARGKGFSAVHFAILGNHVHLVMESPEKPNAPHRSLKTPIHSVSVSFAKRLNSLLKRSGPVFFDRYHLRFLKTPIETRRVIAYVLSNEHKHRQRLTTRKSPGRPQRKIEISLSPFSSALSFSNWPILFSKRLHFSSSSWSEQTILNWYSEILSPPKTWLLREGWKKAQGAAP